MKNYIIISFTLLILSSCKKTDLNPLLIAKWSEQAPCVAGTGSCFVIQFNNDGTYAETSACVCNGTYKLTNNSTNITFTGGLGTGTYDYQVSNNNTTLIIEKYYTGYYFDTPFFHKDVVLIKTN